ncbi:Tim10/DDP family zinc finger-domain-containing protein [Nemania sp. FL0916]|nr:Tim10/DDP family zinc finger-domain-containing protein [Nemania sp. FL0916]
MDDGPAFVETATGKKLSDAERAQLRKILQMEAQKEQIQRNVHSLTNICFPKCVTKTIKSGQLDRAEETCLANCANRMMDVSAHTVKHLTSLSGNQ